MGQRKVTILEPAVEEVARIALFIESEGLPKTAKKFVDEAFAFFASLSDELIRLTPDSIFSPVHSREQARFATGQKNTPHIVRGHLLPDEDWNLH